MDAVPPQAGAAPAMQRDDWRLDWRTDWGSETLMSAVNTVVHHPPSQTSPYATGEMAE